MLWRYPTAPWKLALVFALAAPLACSDDPGVSGDAAVGLSEPTPIRGTTVFPQRIPTEDGQAEIFPGQANYWDLEPDFSIGQGGLSNGGVGQIVDALALEVTIGDQTQPFPDQAYDELSWWTPLFGPGDGVTTAVACDGKACLAPTVDSRLSQTLDLREAVPPLRLEFEATEELGPAPAPTPASRLEHFTDEPNHFRVVIRNTQGDLLESVVEVDAGDVCCTGPSVYTLGDGLAGQQVVLSFEQRGPANGAQTIIDDVAVCADGASPCGAENLVANGGFDAGLDGWTPNSLTTVRNVRTGTHTLTFGEGSDAVDIRVTRSFYAPPGSVWARMVDVYENPADEVVCAQRPDARNCVVELSADYSVGLAAGAQAITYVPTDADNLALASWDGGLRGIRDVGWVMGLTTDFDFLSDPILGEGRGWGVLYANYDFAVAAGQGVGIAHFLVLPARATGVPGVGNIGVRAESLDVELRRIVSGYPEDGTVNAYNEGLTQEQLDAIANF
jgi:hypothetical protein